jgi:DNA-directed RNA polymerase specialized sigma24 family protein
MSSEKSVTRWLNLLRAGDRNAIEPLLERFFHLLQASARKKLVKGAASRRAADEEDAALSAFWCFCRGVEKGKWPSVHDRNDLRRLLLVIVARKAGHQVRDEGCAKRGGGKLQHYGQDDEVLAQLIDREPTPELAAQIAEECERLLDKLGNDDLRTIALRKVEGHTDVEIAEKLGRSERTVARKLAVIRDLWSEERTP